jgi:protein SCO1/2
MNLRAMTSLIDNAARYALRTPVLLAASLLAAALALAACDTGGGSADEAQGPPPLEGAALGGDFALVDENGEDVNLADWHGKWTMIYFGYTFCPDVCPYDVQRMSAGYAAFAKAHPDLADDVVPLFITVDPARDTPAVLREFTDAFSPDLIGLTGSEEQLGAAAKSFGAYFERGEESEGGGYLMDHSRAAYLMDREGKPIALLPVEQSAEGVTQELEKWVR